MASLPVCSERRGVVELARAALGATDTLGAALGVETEPGSTHAEILDRLERGEITAKQAAEELRR